MSNLSDFIEVGGGGSYNFVASGTIGNGDTVALNTDGTVSVVAENTTGTAAVFESASTDYISSTYDSTNGKVVIAYRDVGNLNYGTAVVGTVSGTSISFGTAVVFESANTVDISVAYDSVNGKAVVAYGDVGNGTFGTAIVGTVSGTSISFGTAVVFESANTGYISAIYDSVNEKVVIAYDDNGNSSFGTAIVGTVSGTSISFGTAVVFESATTERISATYDSVNGKVVIAYRDVGNTNFGTAIVGTVSGTSISFGTAVVFESANVTSVSAVYDSTNGKVVIAYNDGGNTFFGTAIVGTVSGTDITFGTAVVFESATTTYISATYDSANGKVVITYQDEGNSSFGTSVIGAVSGTSISFGTAVVFESASTGYISSTYDSTNGEVVISYLDGGNSNFGTSIVLETTTNQDFIGIAEAAASDTDLVGVTIDGGTSDNQSALTTGTTYYVDTDGTLITTNTGVLAGRALSATELLVGDS